jgi:adenine-specific DNA-methyltransferase
MANLSQQNRERMLAFLEELKKQHTDDNSLIAIGEIERELTSKKYGLVWEQHEEGVDVKMRTHIPVFVEDKSREIVAKPDGTDYNFLLEGDNLHSLKLLEKTHRGKIDVIYIDPPYNRGKTNFKYDDDYIVEEDGFRHSKWASFMYERLTSAKKLLSKKGLIFIHIDDNEQACLKLLMDDIFGNNYISTLIWDLGTGTQAGQFTRSHEYIFVYALDKSLISNFSSLEEGSIKHGALKKISKKNPPVTITFPAGFPCLGGDRVITGEIGGSEKEFIHGEMVIKNGALAKEVEITAGFAMRKQVEAWIRGETVYDTKGQLVKGFYFNASGILFYEKVKSTENPKSVLRDVANTKNGTDELENIFGSKPFDFPKPTALVEHLLGLAVSLYNSPIILDFFAGTGTTGQAVLNINSKLNRNCRFILCTNNENRICEEVTYQRLKTVITGKRADGSEYSDGIPANLMYYKTDFVAKDSEYLSDDLLEHIVEMIQLEYGVRVDGKRFVMIMTDEEMDDFERSRTEYKDLRAVFVSQDVLLSAKQEQMLRELSSFVIPDYYFDFELREAGELW